MTYAPGTWFARGTSIHTNYGGSKTHKVADARQSLFTQECQDANARLIAAAPDLLAELINLVDAMDNGWSDPAIADKAREAIAKAKGA